jgi:hypothetical protein
MTDVPAVVHDTTCDIALGEERQRFWDRQPRLSAGLWFGTTGALGWLVATSIRGISLSDSWLLLQMVVIVSAASALLGILLGKNIGCRGRSAMELCKAVFIGVVVSHVSTLVFFLIFSMQHTFFLGDVPALCAALLSSWRIYVTDPVTLWLFSGPVAASLSLYMIRKKVVIQPKQLGCGQHAAVEIVQKHDEPVTDIVN